MTINRNLIRILIADDHPMFRDGLRAMLQESEDFKIVGEAANGSEALAMARQTLPDVLLLDVSMPVMTGFDVLRELAPIMHNIRCVLLTAGIDRTQTIHALQLGARGVVSKDSASETLFKSIHCVMDDQIWVSRDFVRDLVGKLKTATLSSGLELGGTGLVKPNFGELVLVTPEKSPVPETPRSTGSGAHAGKFGLTPRELEIVTAIIDGQSNRDIALTYGISEYTVKHHLTRIFDKVGVFSRLELAMFAIHHELSSPVRATTTGPQS
jgi:DNA-binding NarL/FixJ family response regulator